jgi:hypothetical protein
VVLRTLLGSTTAVIVGCVALSAAASGSSAGPVFYLTTHPRQCLIASGPAGKRPLLVPCSNPRHNFEVYAIGHGGWGHGRPPSSKTVLGIARSVCLSAYQRITGHAVPAGTGWNAYWPDPGAETARYGDKLICSFRAWPRLAALGSGWHVR